MEQSESIKELASALCKAQAELRAAEMTAINPFLKNKYADLGENIKASRPALTKYGLSVVQPVSSSGDNVIVTTMLMHESGEWIRDTMEFPLAEARGKSLAQEAGSIITYLRRYGYAAMVGLYADEDTDGETENPAVHTNKKNHETTYSVKNPIQNMTGTAADLGATVTPLMDLETAEAVMTSEKSPKRYGDLDTEILESMKINVEKAMARENLTIAQKEALQFKKSAITTILQARNQALDGGEA